jgi:hypothetical protein
MRIITERDTFKRLLFSWIKVRKMRTLEPGIAPTGNR